MACSRTRAALRTGSATRTFGIANARTTAHYHRGRCTLSTSSLLQTIRSLMTVDSPCDRLPASLVPALLRALSSGDSRSYPLSKAHLLGAAAGAQARRLGAAAGAFVQLVRVGVHRAGAR
jgi:hypothetical protein